MAFADVDYDTYVIAAAPDSVPLWDYRAWLAFVARVEPLMPKRRGVTGVRGSQYTVRDVMNEETALKLGPLEWSDAGHALWTHGAPLKGTLPQERYMSNMSIWTPRWDICTAQRRAPDMYIALHNRISGGAPDYPRHPYYLFAIAREETATVRTSFRSVVKDVARQARASFFAYRQRPWGLSAKLPPATVREIEKMGASVPYFFPLDAMEFYHKPMDVHARPLRYEDLGDRGGPMATGFESPWVDLMSELG